MSDNEMDELIRKAMQKDVNISDKANDVFKNFEMKLLASESSKKIENVEKIEEKAKEEPVKEKGAKIINFFRTFRNVSAVAASFVIVAFLGVGAAVWTSGNKGTDNVEDESTQSWSIGLNGGGSSADYITAEVKNEEVDEKAKANMVVRMHDNSYVRGYLYSDGSVAVQLKPAFISEYKMRLDSSKVYKVAKITGKVTDVFVGSMYSEKNTYLFLVMSDGTAQVVPILDGEITRISKGEYAFSIASQGKIEGLTGVGGFEEVTEPIYNSDEYNHYVYAKLKDGRRKIISNTEKVDMNLIGSRMGIMIKSTNKLQSEYVYKSEVVYQNGTANASNAAFYVSDESLYEINLITGRKTKLATGVQSVEYSSREKQVYARLSMTNTIHRQNQYVRYMEYSVTDSPIKSEKMNENYIAVLKEDGSISVMLRDGAIKNLNGQSFFKENFVYNFYASGNSKYVTNTYTGNSKDQYKGNYYADAKTMYFGYIGSEGKTCIAYVNNDGKYVVVNLDKFVRESIGGFFASEPGNADFVIASGTLSQKNVSRIEQINHKVKLQNGNSVRYTTIRFISSNNELIQELETDKLLREEGIVNYTLEE